MVNMDPLDRVKDMVRRALATNPKVTNRELMERAREVAPSAVDGLSLQQFHARFRLPVLRHEMQPRQKQSEPRSRRRRPRTPAVATAASPAASLTGELRDILVRFGVDLEAAASRSDLVRVVGGIDAYVNDILAVAQRHLGANGGAPEPRRAPEPAQPRVDNADAVAIADKPPATPPPSAEGLRNAFREWRDEGSRRALPGGAARADTISRIPWSAPTARGGPQT